MLKLCMKWDNDTYIGKDLAFGWVNGSTAFQHVSDGDTFILSEAGIKMFAYVDDYILISPKATADRDFDTIL